MQSTTTEKRPGWAYRTAWLPAAVLAAFLLATGWGDVRPQTRGEEKPRLSADLGLIPPDAVFFVHYRLREGRKTDPLVQLVGQLTKENPDITRELQRRIGLPLGQLSRVTMTVLSPKSREPLLILATAKPFDRAKLLGAVTPQAEEHHSKERTYYTSKKADGRAVYLANDHVYMTGPVEDVVEALSRLARPSSDGPLGPALRLAGQTHRLTLGFHAPEEMARALRAYAGKEVKAADWFAQAALQYALPLADAQLVSAVLDTGDVTTLRLQLNFADQAKAKTAYWPARDGLALARMAASTALTGFQSLFRNKEVRVMLSADDREAAQTVIRTVVGALRSAVINQEDRAIQITVRARITLDTWLAAVQTLATATAKVRQAARRTQSANNLRQIGIAFHDYHDAYKKLPAAAIFDKQGKPLLSWRVAILPFLEQANLYNEFHLDEPWDSEHNKKLLAAMPRIYAPIGVKPKVPYSTYYQVFVGKGAAFEGKEGLRLFADFQDGTANTIWLAEGAEAVPWTKPEELTYDPKKPLPRLGGMFREGFHVGFADASVQFIRRTIKPDLLRALITRNGGEVIDLTAIP